jgi:hypothetical protein
MLKQITVGTRKINVAETIIIRLDILLVLLLHHVEGQGGGGMASV